MRDLIGRTLGHYRIVEKIGEGGMGEGYRARDPRLGRDVALKTIRADALTSPGRSQELVARLRREAGAAARLSHPNIAAIRNLEKDPETSDYYLVMECVEGVNLRQFERDKELLRELGFAVEARAEAEEPESVRYFLDRGRTLMREVRFTPEELAALALALSVTWLTGCA